MEDQDKIIHDFDESSKNKSIRSLKKSDDSHVKKPMNAKNKIPIVLFVILAVLGVATGYIFSQVSGPSKVKVAGPGGKITTANVEKGQVFGSEDEKTFKDSAEGTLREGGIDGEGAFHLERPGGESQNVYLTSSVIDLSSFLGRKVKVWGETNAAQKAGWLMDVGRLQVL
jgi:hypothetical protein